MFFIYAAELIVKTRIPFGLVFFLSSVILIGIISSSSPAYTQQQSQEFPSSIIAASSTDTTPHALKLRAIQQGEDGQPKKVSGFKNDLTNVIPAQINSQVLVSITDNSLLVTGAKVRTASDQLIDLIPSTGQTNAFSLRGLPAGVYNLDIITQKGNTKAAYEGILVLGQDPTNLQTRTLVERQTSSLNGDNDEDGDGNGGNGDGGEGDGNGGNGDGNGGNGDGNGGDGGDGDGNGGDGGDGDGNGGDGGEGDGNGGNGGEGDGNGGNGDGGEGDGGEGDGNGGDGGEGDGGEGDGGDGE